MTTLTSFAVRRRDPELVRPARPTPRETKRLSDIDDQIGLRWHMPLVFFYRGREGGVRDDDPARVVRRALGEALVPYYPLAGRLRELEDGSKKLVVECTGEGVVFVEADAAVRLADLEPLRPPFPRMDQLLFADADGCDGVVVNTPLLLVQVTRLRCGGFVLALRLNHTLCDAAGVAQFLIAVGELARGLIPAPSVAPAWHRELLDARAPPRPSFPHPEYDVAAAAETPPPLPPPPLDEEEKDMVTRTFTFTPADIAAMIKKNHLKEDTTTFEAVAAALWRARTAALGLPSGATTRLIVVAGVRGVRELGIPAGYYGNACVFPAAVAAAGALLGPSPSPLAGAVELVREAKNRAASAEYARSSADALVLRGRPRPPLANLLLVADNRRAGYHRVDFGWGQPVYGGPAAASFVSSYLVAVGNGDISVAVVLPRRAMERFAAELHLLMVKGHQSRL